MARARMAFVVLPALLWGLAAAAPTQTPWSDWRARAMSNAAKQEALVTGLNLVEGQFATVVMVDPGPRRMRRLVKVSSYSPTPEQCGPAGRTKSGRRPQPGWHVALSHDLKARIPFGSKVNIPGLGWREVQDTTAHWMRNTVDVMVPEGDRNISAELIVEFVLEEG